MLSEPSASTQMKTAFCSLVLFLKGQSEAVPGVWAALNAGAGGVKLLNSWGQRCSPVRTAPVHRWRRLTPPSHYQPTHPGAKGATSVLTARSAETDTHGMAR